MSDKDTLTLTKPPVMKAQMLIRKPVHEVFRVFTDPALTTKVWFTKSSGALRENAEVTWEWEMYGVSTKVSVRKIEVNKLIRIEWNNEENPTTVEWKFHPMDNGETTYVTITESGYVGNGDEVVAAAIGSMGGFSFLLTSTKALLEHDIQLELVADHIPKGAEAYL